MIDLCRINVQEGTVTELITEECSPHINLTLFNYKILEQGRYFIWWSERTGSIAHIDTLKKEIIFAGYGNEENINPYYAFFYKARFDGKKQVLLTPGNGNYELTLSEDKRYAIDKYSRMDLLPVINVLSVDNPKKYFEVEQMDGSELQQAGWRPPVLLKIKAADGETDLYGLMYLRSIGFVIRRNGEQK